MKLLSDVQTCEIDFRLEKIKMVKLLNKLKKRGKIENFYAL